MSKSKYPQHDRVKEIKHLSQACHEFMEFLFDKGICLAEEEGRRLEHSSQRHDHLIAEFFEVDLKAFNKEKDDMYDELVRENQARQGK